MRLSELIEPIGGDRHAFEDREIEDIQYDSRRVNKGTLFVCIPGEKTDGHCFAVDAARRGAAALVTQRVLDLSLPQIVVSDTRQALGRLARRFYPRAVELSLIGITGTNGKTITSFLLHSILQAAGFEPGLIGTIRYQGRKIVKANRTTPESLDIFRFCDTFRAEGMRSVVMEVSSHGLSQRRVEELRFRVGIFTNLSQDHLDYHGTMEAYRTAKLHLFDLLEPDGIAVGNADDAATLPSPGTGREVRSFGMTHAADYTGTVVSQDLRGINMRIRYAGREYAVQSHLCGRFNAYNILAAFAAAHAFGAESAAIVAGIGRLRAVPGRMEQVVPQVFVDFAHTPRALENALETLRQFTAGRLIAVFGCGGDRDRTKRPLMGRIGCALADQVILTSDNPRSEAPLEIIREIAIGCTRGNPQIIEDRRAAIAAALAGRRPQDVVLVAGKGHEETQTIGTTVAPFDDAAVIRDLSGWRGQA